MSESVEPPTYETAYVPDPRRWKALAVCFTGGFVTMLDVSIVNVALPSMQHALNAGAAQLQIIIAGYTLAFGLVLVPFGRLGDAHGRRRMFMIAMAGFALFSLLSGVAQTDTQLAVFRLLQGAFAGMSSPQVSGMIQQMFRGHERAKAFGFLGATIGVSTAIGPVVGGLILWAAGTATGWRWIFLINVPICLGVLPLARRLLPDPMPATSANTTRLDIIGLVFIALGTATFMAPFVTTPTTGFFHEPQRWLWLVPAFILAPVTFFWERRYQRRYNAAVLNPGLLRNQSYVFGAALGAAYFAGFTGLMLIVSMMMQTGMSHSAMATGVVQLPFAIGSAFMASRAGALVPRWGRRLVVAGLTAYLTGLAAVITLIWFVPTNAIPYTLAIALLVMGAGGGAIISPNQALSFQDVPPQFGSVAGAVLQVGQRAGAAVGVAIVLAAYLSVFVSSVASLGPVQASRHAASIALALSSAFIIAALVVGILDLRRRHDLR